VTLLRERDFRNFWLGETISLFGDQISLIALPLAAVLVLDAGAADMGYLTAAGLAPHLILSLPAGVWLDRVARRRRVMIAADLVRASLVGSVPIAYAVDAALTGKLGSLGQPVLRSKAREMEKQFAARLAAAFEQPQSGAVQ